jgi:hypothetical protein
VVIVKEETMEVYSGGFTVAVGGVGVGVSVGKWV